jgi:hypothetical protein
MISLMANHATIIRNQTEIERALAHQHRCIEALKLEVSSVSAIVAEVRELLAALKVFSGVIKYVAVVGAAIVSAWHGFKAAWKFWT